MFDHQDQLEDPGSTICSPPNPVERRRERSLLRTFLRSEDGPTAVEYAVMLALIVVVCLTAIKSVGSKASTTFSNIASSLSGS